MLVMAQKKANPWPARLRKLQGDLSNQAMADKLGVPLDTYLAWKYGKRTPSRLAMLVIKNKLQ